MELLISLLITLLIFVIVWYIVLTILSAFGAEPNIVKIVKLILLLIALVWIFRVVGVWGGGPYFYYGRPRV